MQIAKQTIFEQDVELGWQKLSINSSTLIVVNKTAHGDVARIIKLSEIDAEYHVGKEIKWIFYVTALIMMALILLCAWFAIRYCPNSSEGFSMARDMIGIMAMYAVGLLMIKHAYPRLRPIEFTVFKNKRGDTLLKIYRPFNKWWEYEDFIKCLSEKIQSKPRS
jgi:hypothetical protein